MGVVVSLEEARDPSKGLQPLLNLVSADMQGINRLILDKAVSDVEMIPELAHHLIDSGGKRLRPMLTIATAKMTGFKGDEHIRVAAAVEFMHTATLLHDDVVDESDFRRGKKSARMIWGNQASVLVGDFLLGQAFRMLVEVGSLQVLQILSNAAAVIAEGEVMQLSAAKNLATTEDEYIAIVNAKTAALFLGAAESGAALAKRPSDELSALRSYGKNLGIAFQLIDDALVLLERELRKYRVSIERQISSTPPALVNPNEIQQVLLNLLINARQAMSEGGLVIIRLAHDAATDTIELMVRDHGQGIPADKLTRIFDPFYSTKDGPDETGKGGAGVGLSRCREIIEAHKGKILVASTVGKGTAFTLKLPVAKSTGIHTAAPITLGINAAQKAAT